ncbi:hypothetical protein [Arthrobacter sp. NPDC090010]|uniref:hypothetical protein n=1 Tax=Arthrobacter sp. NPDC090010 TaxID=3363942 RepID=UPI00381F5130
MNQALELQAVTLAKTWTKADLARLAVRHQDRAYYLHLENRALKARLALYEKRERAPDPRTHVEPHRPTHGLHSADGEPDTTNL